MYPYLFTIGNFHVRMYGIITILAIFLSTGVAYFLAKQDGRWHKYVWDIGLYGGLAGIVGGRLWDVFFFDWNYYSNHLTEIFNIWQGGMAIQGGLLFGATAGIIYCIIHKIDILEFGDIVCPSMILGQSIGRIANLLNGDAFGAPTHASFGILYPNGSLARNIYGDLLLWPTEIWEGQIDIIIFAILIICRSANFAKGQVLCIYPILYSISRFFLEYIRGDYVNTIFWGLRSAQISSLIIIIVFFILFIYFGHKKTSS